MPKAGCRRSGWKNRKGKDMSDKRPIDTENADPTELNTPVPRLIIGLIIGLIAWGIGYILMADPTGVAALGDRRAPAALVAADAGAAGVVIDGRQLYANTCQACHQATGQGLPGVFPPLAGSEWVTGDEHILAQIVLHGLTGPIEVAGVTYDGAMPAFGGQLNDAQLAAVLTFIRSEWGNGAPAVEDATAKAARAATAGQEQPWAGIAQIKAALNPS